MTSDWQVSSVLWPKSLEYVLGGGKPPASERRRP